MADKKLLVVLGATGKQGGSVINSILGDEKAAAQFSIRAITRDPSKQSAQALAKRGVECVKADLNSKESLIEAFKGAYAVYAVTNFWETGSAETEIRQGKNIADAAKLTGVSHFDSKAAVEEYIRSIDVPATFFLPGFYMSNIPAGTLNNVSGVYNFSNPVPNNTPIPLFDSYRDTGKFVKAILLNREKVLGKQIYGATDYYTPDRIIAEFQAVKTQDGQGGAAIHIPDEDFKGILAIGNMSEKAREEMLQNMQLLYMFGYYGGASLKESLDLLDEAPTTWKKFVEQEPAWAHLK
ncbi:NmrA family transcriptional regulator, putative [Trichophyton benhamiae CBS 112371]|uniref:NmrA family transcriptional regulator, putative n=1 Tax=Arthroderma benhamiae (strain ATCC MYA-4681 / CBS 112371) TaxID=663331 RepID=D4AXC7_ARTBC|nr:NmrA family transcriptional regulator, putative [Trichophyton benhamiae CBS 112371]EFE32332.1 NmrA family transcriptional regulator, putative [Trichophyton benhamiae CBS 112371]